MGQCLVDFPQFVNETVIEPLPPTAIPVEAIAENPEFASSIAGHAACWAPITVAVADSGGPPEPYLDSSTTISPVNQLMLFNF
jgi:hypothetical protein